MPTEIREVLNDHWRRLEHRPPPMSPVVAVSELPVPTPNGSLAAALDSAGNRHLLVPVGAHQNVRKGLNGPVLMLHKRTLDDERTRHDYADLVCLRSDLSDIFTTLCADILVATEAAPDNPMKVFNRVLDRWKALFQNPGPPLGPQQLAGLFGELIVLARLLKHDSSAHLLWRGPSGYRHDFATDAGALEVKTSTSPDGRQIRIHGLDQLEPPTNGALGLVWLRLEPTVREGLGLLDLINRVLELADDEAAVLNQLALVGYRTADDDHYRHARYEIGEQRWYNVDVAFPRLTTIDLAAATISSNVRHVDYTIDLSGDTPEPMEDSQVERHIRVMIEEHL
ncbi:PD-(D/E)XK motif protein [Nocardia sp. NBC_01730]|uniref:PD-(D/E)XK motif protein n=1 Tax=Nocardia sp. NBC_01730 TaxID=2975998 RepID=UPI002E0F8A57|nr:PD-(D/E)XK motif protein [Nocardia sp. NBC_01730]